ncbi:presequence protease, mitochondrial [Nomia melanderi]|uniref:presequence protease, mitochondrial n=1 Tax=Nomia melanderi TaxID=2448451 RepID=UPI0013047635|nr:presequence protease, mitochondrial [Nomia melanderi]XP_031845607.1 presequence protease, mitochondrial [Nomia melanderi]XP_031845608.1 presequence protease, mitochondrial [Nomia melanderi]XP_031845609.1 presequence protease, mitochondrial [Nomia melanderi]
MLRILNLSQKLPSYPLGQKLLKSYKVPYNFRRNLTTTSICCKEDSSFHKNNKYQVGQVINGFIVDEIGTIDEIQLTAVRLTHLGSGAQYLHLARDDYNNVFSVGFRTTPKDSTGLPHILEHITLCGSERYPCRDPFFKMLRRSLATFMNAMTGPDYTIYPFSTQNLKDYRNLQSVYLDSVFKPNLRELDFRQEGWRLEHTDVNDKNSPIIFKGVVFNEMKGVFNENQSILAEQLLNSILPSHTYSVISGGDPLVIPNLRHIDLVNFHKMYYHPSNSRFYSYGNFPLEDHLKFVNDRYLFLADKIDTSISVVPPEKRWDKARKEHILCRPDPMAADPNRQGNIAIGYLCNDIIDTQKTFEMHVLSQLLLRGPNSEFYKSLVESKLADAFGPMTGYDNHCKDTMFVLSLIGVKEDDFEKIDCIFNETVEKIIEKGFETDQIEAILHGIELQIKHQTSNFGLQLLFNLTPLWNHNGNLIQSMRINNEIRNFREEMEKNPNYLQELVKKYFMDNTHRLTLTMLPCKQYDHNKTIAERELLESKLKKLSKEELDQIYIDGQILLQEQQKKEDSNVLPTLKIEDIKTDVERYNLKDLEIVGVPLQVAVEPTNTVCYYRGILNTQGLVTDLKMLLPLFNHIITKMGSNNYDYRIFDQMIRLKTGGLSFMNHVVENKSNLLQYEEGVLIESYCLDRNVDDMWRLWFEIFNNVKLSDLQRFETVIKSFAANLVNGIADSGHIYAMSTAASLVSPVTKFKETISGLEFVSRMKKIAQMQDLGIIFYEMQLISEQILNKQHLRSAINLSENNKDNILNSIAAFYESLKSTPKSSYIFTSEQSIDAKESAIHYVLPYTVNYVSKAVLTVPYTNSDFAPLQILAKLISSVYLHPEIREKGGAYGGGAKLSSDGVFTFYSYRDPNSTRTLDVFDKTYDFLTKYSFSDTDIDEAKLGVFQRIDAPIPPCNRGMIKFTHNITDDDMQKYRQQLKAVTTDQLLYVAKKYLEPGQKDVHVGRALIGPVNQDLLSRHSENWIVQNQDEEAQARAVE